MYALTALWSLQLMHWIACMAATRFLLRTTEGAMQSLVGRRAAPAVRASFPSDDVLDTRAAEGLGRVSLPAGT